MSEHLVRLIPRLHTYRSNDASARAAVLALQKCVKAEEISFFQSGQVEFFDCGSALNHISCPRCGAAVPLDWWQQKMDEHYKSDHFFVLEEDMPCCSKTVSLNDLRYEAPCGFASLCFTVRDPEEAVGQEAVECLSERFGILFRTVEAVY